MGTKKLITCQLDAALGYHRFPPTSANGPAFLIPWTRNSVTGVFGYRFRPDTFFTPFPWNAGQNMCFIESPGLY
jgi:hypothetical protein